MKRLTTLILLAILSLSCSGLHAEQFTDSVRVHFKVNQSVIDTVLMGNNDAMNGFAQRMSALSDLSNSSDFEVKINSILITGAASPEGSVAVNEHLSRQRAATITRWLHNYLEFPDSLPEFVFKGRDWGGLLLSVIGDPDVPYKKEVLNMLRDIITPPPQALTNLMT